MARIDQGGPEPQPGCVSSPSAGLALFLLLFVPLIDVTTAAGAAPRSSTPDQQEALASARQSSSTLASAASSTSASGTGKSSGEPSPAANPESSAAAVAATAANPAEQQRTELNLLGQTDASSGGSRRNADYRGNPPCHPPLPIDCAAIPDCSERQLGRPFLSR